MISAAKLHDCASASERQKEEISAKKRIVKETLCCPYCDLPLDKWEVPDSPFIEWPSQYQFICFNDECSYFKRGWETMARQGGVGSYRFMFDPPTGGCYNVVVLSSDALRDGIVSA